MLSSSSLQQPKPVDPMTRVKVLVPIMVGGKAREVGETVSMTLSDAEALRSISRVEFID